MSLKLKSVPRVLLAMSAILFVAGCFASDKVVAVKPDLPELPDKLSAPCYDAGVARDAFAALTDNRVAWAACRTKHNDLVAFYNDVRGGMQ